MIPMHEVMCSACGIHFAMPEDFHEQKLRDGKVFRCPNGHEISFEGYVRSQALETKIKELEALLAEKNDEIHRLKCDFAALEKEMVHP